MCPFLGTYGPPGTTTIISTFLAIITINTIHTGTITVVISLSANGSAVYWGT